ncbi:alpha-galactosidase [Brachybacterium epidermidis]|uniref:alpha-galactosidase n=1 Tax=Brachybacterium epidermidis TaxID=2781983 RepID=UPI00398EC813
MPEPSDPSLHGRGPQGTTGPTRRIHLSAAGVSVVLDVTGGRIPAILHWGRELGPVTAADAVNLAAVTTPPVANNAPDIPLRLGILPQNADGWLGTPGVTGSRADGSGFAPRLTCRSVRIDGQELQADFLEVEDGRVTFDLADEAQGLEVGLEVELTAHGLLRTRAQVTNTGSDEYTLASLTPALPVPLDATELLDFAGRWTHERTPQRRAFTTGTHLRENRRGRTGADAAHLLHAGTAGFDFGSGQVWAVHVGFSGNHTHLAERTSGGTQILAGGELLLPGEGRLAAGDTYRGPWLYGSYGNGLDRVARRFHRHLRSRENHVSVDRPVTLNVWEAVYFDHDLERLTDLADRAAALGVERYVLDDGWFGSRRDDTSGLGDWQVSPEVWPDGLGPLIDHVTGLGMQFGLWFEPEMVNIDSEVARAHPEWVMAPSPQLLPVESRYQQVLNLSHPGAFEHVHRQMNALLNEYDIAYIKWDHNRDLIEAADRSTGAAATHAQTLAAYRLMDRLKADHPGLEIESCSSGGARVDLGVLERTDRVWVSDCIDPLERLGMNRWTSQLIPFELMGSHIASGRSHTTGRLHSLSFRAASALMGHLGIEWDLAEASQEELAELRTWIQLYKEQRELLFTGDLVRADCGLDALWLTGVVSADKDRALYVLACAESADVAPGGQLRLPGLDPRTRYRVRPLVLGEAPSNLRWPAWAVNGVDPATDRNYRGRHELPLTEGIELSGAALASTGLSAPLMDPETAVLFEVIALSPGTAPTGTQPTDPGPTDPARA